MLFTNNPEVLPSWPMEAHTSGSLWVGETTQLVLVTQVHFIVGSLPLLWPPAGLEMWLPLLGPPFGHDKTETLHQAMSGIL